MFIYINIRACSHALTGSRDLCAVFALRNSHWKTFERAPCIGRMHGVSAAWASRRSRMQRARLRLHRL